MPVTGDSFLLDRETEDLIRSFEWGAAPAIDGVEPDEKLVNAIIQIVDTARRNAEKNLRNIFLQCPFAITILSGLDLKIEFANDKALELWGRTHEQVINKTIFESFPELYNQGFGQILTNVYTTGQRFVSNENSIRLFRKGQLADAYINFVYEPLRDLNGTVTGIMGVGIEVTTETETRKKIEESENRFRNIIANVPVAITIFRGPDFIVELANNAYLHIVDRKAEAFIGKPLLEALPELAGQGIKELLTGVLNTGIPYYGNELAVAIVRFGERELCYFNFVYYPLREADNTVSGIMVVVNDVTQLVLARHEVEERARQFKNLVMSSPIGMAIFRGEDYLIELANTAVLENIWHRKQEDVENKKLLEVFPELTEQAFPALLNHVRTSGITYREKEARAVVHSDGKEYNYFLDFEYAPLFEADGTVSGIMVTAVDVTDRVEARQKAEEAGHRLRLANEAAQLGTFDWDLENNIFTQSQRVAEIFGVGHNSNNTHQSLLDAFHPEDFALRNKAVDASFLTGTLFYEARVVWPDKSIHWIRVNGKSQVGVHSQHLRMYGTVQDITKERTILNALAESEDRLRIATDSAGLATWDLQLNPTKIFYSPRLAVIFGYEEGALLTHADLRDSIHPDDLPIVMQAHVEAVEKGTLRYEVRVIKKDKTICWIRSNGKTLYDDNHRALRMLGIVVDITQQKEIFNSLQESEERNRLATESAALGTFDLDLVTGKVIYSKRYLEIFGYKEHVNWQREDFYAHVHPDDLNLVKQAMQQGLKTGMLEYEARIVWKDNSVHWIKKNGKTFYNEKHEPVRMIGTLRDITDGKLFEANLVGIAKRATTELRQSEELNSRMVSEIQDYAIIFLNKNGFIENWNKGAEKIKGYKEAEIIGKHFRLFYTKEDQLTGLPERLLAHVVANGRVTAEGWRVRKDGSRFWGYVTITALHDEHENIIGFTKVTRDLTEKRIADEQLELQARELKEKNYELEQQKHFVDVILDSSVDVISVFDTDLRYISVNSKFEEMYNLKREDILGKSVEDIFPPEQTTVFRDNLKQAISGENIHNLFHLSVITGKYYESFFIPLKQNDEVYAVLTLAHDNTAIFEASKKLEITNRVLEEKTADLQKANAALEKSNSELEQYAYIASHDLQEPLRKIRTYSGMLDDELKSKGDASANTLLKKVIDSATRMSNLIYDLLNFSRLLNPEKIFERTSLDKLLKNIISDFELVIEQKKATVEVGHLPDIEAIPLQMNQLFYNLLNNALKFSREQAPPVIIIKAQKLQPNRIPANYSLDANLDYIEIIIEDNGIGFSQQYAEQIFEVFKRLHTKQAYQGSGIGLALCRRIAINHHGDIYAEGKENAGSIFHVFLPLKQPLITNGTIAKSGVN